MNDTQLFIRVIGHVIDGERFEHIYAFHQHSDREAFIKFLSWAMRNGVIIEALQRA